MKIKRQNTKKITKKNKNKKNKRKNNIVLINNTNNTIGIFAFYKQ